MFYSWMLLLMLGMYLEVFSPVTASGNITMSLSVDEIFEASLESLITTFKRNVVLYKKKEKMKNNKNNQEITITFQVSNVSEPIIYSGHLFLLHPIYKQLEKYEFPKHTIRFYQDLKKKKPSVHTVYNTNFNKRASISVTTKCQENYYPELNCNVYCYKTKHTSHCDLNGKKICKQGYYLESDQCIDDWCSRSEEKCTSNGRCENKGGTFICRCKTNYNGKYCEVYSDPCQNYRCPNKTQCLLVNESVVCSPDIVRPNTTILKAKHTISNFTLMLILAFLIIIIITSSVTCWACRTPNPQHYKSVEASIHSNNTYYHNGSMTRIPSCCQQCHLDLQTSLNLYNTIYGNRGFYSLRHPNNRILRPSNRAFSDIVLSPSYNKKDSTSSCNDLENLPLPPVVDEDSIML